MERREQITNYFNTLRTNNSLVDVFFAYMNENHIHYAALGGSIRAALNSSKKIRDIDIVYQADDNLIELFLQKNNIWYRRNSFNGLKFSLDSMEFDVWNICDHFSFKNQIYNRSFENLYKTTLINYDSIAYDFSENILYDKYYQEFLNDNTIELISSRELANKNPNKALTICKILELEKKQSVNISTKTEAYIRNYCKAFDITDCMWELKKSYKKHYNKKMNDTLSWYVKDRIKSITRT